MNVSLVKLNQLMREACPSESCTIELRMDEKNVLLRWEFKNGKRFLGFEHTVAYEELDKSGLTEMTYLTHKIEYCGECMREQNAQYEEG